MHNHTWIRTPDFRHANDVEIYFVFWAEIRDMNSKDWFICNLNKTACRPPVNIDDLLTLRHITFYVIIVNLLHSLEVNDSKDYTFNLFLLRTRCMKTPQA